MATIDGWWAAAQDHGKTVNVKELLERGGGYDAVRRLSEGGLRKLGVPPILARGWGRGASRSTRGTALRLIDEDYPDSLRRLEWPPPVLFVDGDPSCLQADCIAIVGTRRCTSRARTMARQLGAGLAAAGVTVVSGLAWGTDAAAHRGAVDVGRTAAVLGHGLAMTSPASNRALRERMVKQGGCVVSTWPDGFTAQKWTFPRRNAWIAGLSRAVVVIEAPLKSGALHTSTHAVDFGRPVYAVPGAPHMTASLGCNQLINEGAVLVDDIDQLIGQLTAAQPRTSAGWVGDVVRGRSLDSVARDLGVSVVDLLDELARLEAFGEVVRLPGHRYAGLGNY